jgi:hypothetical protein
MAHAAENVKWTKEFTLILLPNGCLNSFILFKKNTLQTKTKMAEAMLSETLY